MDVPCYHTKQLYAGTLCSWKTAASVCTSCWNVLKQKHVPSGSLANGLWIGDVPPELQALNFVEKLLVARYRHSVCIVKLGVRNEQRRYHGNVIVFAQPVAKLYQTLPPPREDLDECLAVMLTGNVKAADVDFARTPLLVRRNVVFNALQWLKANHKDYGDLEISQENLAGYNDSEVPVPIMQRNEAGDVTTVAPPVYDHDKEMGTTEGTCSFAVSAQGMIWRS